MPPVTKAGGDAFRKEVAFTEKDDAEQRATGIVMVPDKVDLQGDFAREDTIRQFAEQFGNFVDAGEGDGGIMHAAWPSEWMSLERNEVLDEAEDIGGTTAPEGAWIQEWQFNDADLWSLVTDGVLEGYSIGAINVDWNGPYDLQEDDAVDDVDTPAQVPDDAMAWELIDGLIREVSAVDIPAVPDAEILDTKADAQKRLADHLGDKDGFVSEMMERGHSEEDAERAWDVLNRAIEVDGAGDPGKESMLERMGKAALSVLSGRDPGKDTASDPAHEKGGRTLSKQNRESAMAAVDANLDMLEDSGMDHDMTRFTDRDDVDFDLSEHDAREWADGAGDPEDEDGDDDEDDKHASGGDTPDDSTDMGDTNDDGGDADKSLAEQNAEQINELTDAVKGLTEAVDSDDDPEGDKTAEVELPSGDVVEVSKSETEEWFETEDGGTAKDADEAAATKADVEALHRRLDAITREGGTQQLDGGNGSEADSGLDELGKMLAGGN